MESRCLPQRVVTSLRCETNARAPLSVVHYVHMMMIYCPTALHIRLQLQEAVLIKGATCSQLSTFVTTLDGPTRFMAWSFPPERLFRPSPTESR